MFVLVLWLLTPLTHAAAQIPEVSEATLQARLTTSCPSASAFEVGSPDRRDLPLHDMAPRRFTADSWPRPSDPWPNVIWSPDSLAYALVTVIDSPPQVFVSSLIDSIGYANYAYLTTWHLLDATWVDDHRFLMVLAPRKGDEALGFRVTLADFTERKEYTWYPSYEGELPNRSSLTARVAEIQHAAEARRAGR